MKATAAIAILTVLLVSACESPQTIAPEPTAEVQAEASQGTFTLEQFNQITTGMTLSKVEAILGTGELVSAMAIEGMEDTTVYQWLNDDGSNITLTFTGDALTSTAQFGLE